MTQPQDQGGIGFDAVWYMDFYHHLIGDGNYGDSYAKLLKNAGYGAPGPLHMDYFAGALLGTQYNKIAYHENHDEAGNDPDTERTIVTAVNQAPLVGATRKYAEGRSRFAFGLAALSAGTPMFLMGEEIGAAKYFRYNDFSIRRMLLRERRRRRAGSSVASRPGRADDGGAVRALDVICTITVTIAMTHLPSPGDCWWRAWTTRPSRLSVGEGALLAPRGRAGGNFLDADAAVVLKTMSWATARCRRRGRHRDDAGAPGWSCRRRSKAAPLPTAAGSRRSL